MHSVCAQPRRWWSSSIWLPCQQTHPTGKESRSTMSITESELDAARAGWEMLSSRFLALDEDGFDAARAVAEQMLNDAYGYGFGPVLFKPTMASGEQTFRSTKNGALSYFVGHDNDFPLDGGFGLKGWRAMRSVTAASFIEGDVAMWMGWVILTDKDGQVTTVDKSFGYRKDDAGILRIVLHHSSLPYEP